MAGTLWYVNTDCLGVDESIGARLAQSFWNSLGDRLQTPATFCFINRGVFLTLDDSPVLQALKRLEAAGSRFYSCGTCLDYWEVRERLAVGEVGSIPILQQLMLDSDKVITL